MNAAEIKIKNIIFIENHDQDMIFVNLKQMSLLVIVLSPHCSRDEEKREKQKQGNESKKSRNQKAEKEKTQGADVEQPSSSRETKKIDKQQVDLVFIKRSYAEAVCKYIKDGSVAGNAQKLKELQTKACACLQKRIYSDVAADTVQAIPSKGKYSRLQPH